MATGQATLAEIERAIADLREKEGAVQNRLEASNAERSKLLESRTRAFREMAEVRTRHAVADGVVDDADRLQHRVAAILAARQTTIDSLKQRLAAAEQRLKKLNEERAGLVGEIAALDARLDQVASEARLALDSDAHYRDQRAKRDAARETHDKARAKAEIAEEDRQTKGRTYEHDPLFMYLWRRRYGLEGYRPMALVRIADNQVARLVGYHDARANYAVLIEIPKRLGEHAARRAELLDQERASLESIEAEKIRALAGKDLPAGLAVARERQTMLNGEIERITAEMAEISKGLNRYAEGLDDSFREAVSISAEFLEDESYQRLVQLARETVEPTDDEIAERIAAIDRKLDELSEHVEEGRQELEQLSKRREELIRVAADFRRSHYDEPGSVLEPDGDLNHMLEELLKGVITGIEYSTRARRAQRWDWRPADPFRRSAGMPPFGGRSGSGRSGSGRSDGGFKTGGGF